MLIVIKSRTGGILAAPTGRKPLGENETRWWNDEVNGVWSRVL